MKTLLSEPSVKLANNCAKSVAMAAQLLPVELVGLIEVVMTDKNLESVSTATALDNSD